MVFLERLQFIGKQLPINEFYCGFKLKPKRIIFYAYRRDELSDVMEYRSNGNGWIEQILSP